jgi:ribulose-5-phosphate 4-epimerase/fuculose-1-phosphate aldolase
VRDQDIRIEMIRICHWLARQSFVVADDGALSARISPDQILITPRGKNLRWVTCQQLVLLTGTFPGLSASPGRLPSQG